VYRTSSRYAKIPLNGKIKFECIRCNLCCGTGPNVTLTVFDVVRMAEYLDRHWRTFVHDFVKVIIAEMFVYLALRDKGNGECVFLEKDPNNLTLCKIYPARPMRCRLYPLYIVTPKSNYLHLDTECPGVGIGKERSVPVKLVERYAFEIQYHYKQLMRLILDEGLEPLTALEYLLDKLWEEAEKGAEWAKIDYLSTLGST